MYREPCVLSASNFPGRVFVPPTWGNSKSHDQTYFWKQLLGCWGLSVPRALFKLSDVSLNGSPFRVQFVTMPLIWFFCIQKLRYIFDEALCPLPRIGTSAREHFSCCWCCQPSSTVCSLLTRILFFLNSFISALFLRRGTEWLVVLNLSPNTALGVLVEFITHRQV